MSTTARGGYQILDFENATLSSTAVSMPGIYEKALNCINKPTVLCNFKITVQGNTLAPSPVYSMGNVQAVTVAFIIPYGPSNKITIAVGNTDTVTATFA